VGGWLIGWLVVCLSLNLCVGGAILHMLLEAMSLNYEFRCKAELPSINLHSVHI
jgi:hypothetical protein